jgi:hypothetical protein
LAAAEVIQFEVLDGPHAGEVMDVAQGYTAGLGDSTQVDVNPQWLVFSRNSFTTNPHRLLKVLRSQGAYDIVMDGDPIPDPAPAPAPTCACGSTCYCCGGPSHTWWGCIKCCYRDM